MASKDWLETTNTSILHSADDSATNPANGLSMVGGCSGLDLCGNLYGSDFNNDGFDLLAPDVHYQWDR